MKSIIKISFLLLFMFLATNSFAQRTGSTVENRVNRLTEYLELDADQKVAVTSVFSEYGNKLRILRLQQTKGATEDRGAILIFL